MRSVPHQPLLSLLALTLGFALMSLAVVERAFEGVALGLAAAGREWLDALGYEVARRGGELRDLVSGFAVEVTDVCDGHGIFIGWAGVLLALGRGWRVWAVGLAAGFAAIQLFNLIRVVALYMAATLGQGAFDAIHYFVFPLLTALLVIGMGAALFERVRRRAALAVGAAVALAAFWFFAAEAVAAAVAVPLANTLLSMLGPAEATTIADRAAGWTVGTRLIENAEPLRLRLAPLTPSDFVLATPMLLGAALAARGGWVFVAAGAAAMVAATALGATTAVWGVAEATGAALVAVPAGPSAMIAEPFAPPSDLLVGLVALAQNVLVHLNLLVLPTLILGHREDVAHG